MSYMYSICYVPLFSKSRLSKVLFFKSFPRKTLTLWISKLQIWIWSEESTLNVDFMDSWSVFRFAQKNAKFIFGFVNPDLDFSKKTYPNSTHMVSTPGIKTGPHWWEASTLTTVTSLASQNQKCLMVDDYWESFSSLEVKVNTNFCIDWY